MRVSEQFLQQLNEAPVGINFLKFFRIKFMEIIFVLVELLKMHFSSSSFLNFCVMFGFSVFTVLKLYIITN